MNVKQIKIIRLTFHGFVILSVQKIIRTFTNHNFVFISFHADADTVNSRWKFSYKHDIELKSSRK